MDDQIIKIENSDSSYRLVLLHGWGADADDLIPIGRAFSKVKENNFEIVSIRAPLLHPSGIGRQWYGLFPSDWKQASESVYELRQRIKNLSNAKIPLEKTIVLGFSQGAAMALAIGCDLPIAGIISCSGYPHPDWEPSKLYPPIVLFHGDQDEIVPVEAAREIMRKLELKDNHAEIFIFKGSHEIPLSLFSKIEAQIIQWI